MAGTDSQPFAENEQVKELLHMKGGIWLNQEPLPQIHLIRDTDLSVFAYEIHIFAGDFLRECEFNMRSLATNNCHYTDCPGICQCAERRGISAGCRFSDSSGDSAHSGTIYRSLFNECLDSSRTRCDMCNTCLVLIAKIYGTVHLWKTSAIKIVTNGFELCDYFRR